MLSKVKVKYIQSLGQKKVREQEGLFVAEGPKLVAELIGDNKAMVVEVFALPEWIAANGAVAAAVATTVVNAIELEKLSQLKTPNEVLALVKQFAVSGEILTNGKVVLALDGIQDPGNMGTLIRIADWFGVEQLVCSMDSADIYNAKVVQATMGSIGRVAVHYINLVDWIVKTPKLVLYAAALNGRDVTTMPKLAEGVIIIGNESKGISDDVLALVHNRITIPKRGNAESLNAGVAAGVILSHLV